MNPLIDHERRTPIEQRQSIRIMHALACLLQVGVIGTVSLAVPAVRAAGVSFKAPVNYPTGANPVFAGTADLNHDHNVDVITNNVGDGTVSVLLGKGGGTYRRHVDYPAGGGGWTSLADVNKDHTADVIISANGGVGVLFGNSDGSFGPVAVFPTGHGPAGVNSADMNHDGNRDLVYSGDPYVGVLLGNGDGTFQPYQEFHGGPYPLYVVAADMNEDGRMDLIVSNNLTADFTASSVSVLLAKRDGTFRPPVAYLTPPVYLGYSTVADVNRDGHKDVFAIGGGGDSVYAFLGNGDGTLKPAVAYPTNPNGQPASVLAISDVNSDGKLDLVSGGVSQDPYPEVVNVRLGRGDGTFGRSHLFKGAGGTMADVNHDGKPDIVGQDYPNDRIQVRLNDTP